MNQRDSRPPRRLRLFLRDHRVLDADARVPHGQYLSTYLASRTRYVNLTDADWLGTGEHIPHLALKVGQILWVSSTDGSLELATPRASAESRRVEVELEGGYLLSAGLLLVAGQRLSDFLQSSPPFVALQDAQLRPRGKSLGDVAVNQDAIQVVRELTGPEEAPRPDATPSGETEPPTEPSTGPSTRPGATAEGVTTGPGSEPGHRAPGA